MDAAFDLKSIRKEKGMKQEELAAIQGPDLLTVHKKVNMTVSERRKLNAAEEKAKQAITTDDCRIRCNGCGVNTWAECPLEGIHG